MAQKAEPNPLPENGGRGDRSGVQRLELDQATQERWIDLAHRHFSDPFVYTLAEAHFSQAGILTVFEESGVLPQVENPNPHDADLSPLEHEQWWVDHPTEGEAFDRSIYVRDERLRLLYIGALFGPHLSRLRSRAE
jgi:hypothetical protein